MSEDVQAGQKGRINRSYKTTLRIRQTDISWKHVLEQRSQRMKEEQRFSANTQATDDHTVIWTGQDYPTGNSSKRETKRQTEETMGR